jgi:predicted adenylyl cyclase CyaB
LYADEIETSVHDGNKLIQILESLGFNKISTIKKRRESWRFNNFQFDCDEVEGLGFFVEIEYKGEIEDTTKGRQVITDFLAEIGIRGWKIIKRGYPWMQWNPDIKHFEE